MKNCLKKKVVFPAYIFVLKTFQLWDSALYNTYKCKFSALYVQ